MLDNRSGLKDEKLSDRSVLIVDNDKRIVDLLKDTLENEGLKVGAAFCGEAAIMKLGEEKYPCVILDYSLPDIKGDELAASFRNMIPSIGIILLTGFKYSINPDRLKLFDYVFEKPGNLEDLLVSVQKILGRVKSEQKRVLAHQKISFLHSRFEYMRRE